MKPPAMLRASDVWRFIRDESGPTSTEYAFVLALIVLTAIGAIASLGTHVGTTCTTISTSFAETK